MSSDVIGRQQTRLHDLYRRHIQPREPYALVDFPDHPNVGDSAIWAGEIACLHAVGADDPSYVCRWDDFDEDALRRACPTGPILIHGGGNLGDIWPHHQHLREAILARFRDRRVVQLPQSIHFRQTHERDRFARVVAGHPDFHLHVRDAPSVELAERQFDCPVTLAPDSAFGLGALARPVEPDCDWLMLMRTDAERVVRDDAPLSSLPRSMTLDWLDEPSAVVADPLARSRVRVERGLRLLSRGRSVMTDRLHGHILSVLLGLPHIVLDNDYGKVGAYIASWTYDSPLVRHAHGPAEAAMMAR